MNSTEGSKKQIIAGLVVLVVIALIVGGTTLANKKSDDMATEPTSAVVANNTSASTETAATSTASFKDGTYTAKGGYNTPGGRNSIDLSITIKNGAISASSASTNAPDRESELYDQMFLDAYKNYVLGKSVGSVNVSRVAGASLTTQGFNNALEQIANQAQA